MRDNVSQRWPENLSQVDRLSAHAERLIDTNRRGGRPINLAEIDVRETLGVPRTAKSIRDNAALHLLVLALAIDAGAHGVETLDTLLAQVSLIMAPLLALKELRVKQRDPLADIVDQQRFRDVEQEIVAQFIDAFQIERLDGFGFGATGADRGGV